MGDIVIATHPHSPYLAFPDSLPFRQIHIMKRRFFWVILVLFSLLLITGLWIFTGGTFRRDAGSETGMEASSRICTPNFEWKVGSKTAYNLEQVTSPLRLPVGGIRVEGILHLRVLEVNDGKAKIALLGSNLKVLENGSRLHEVESLLEEVPCIVTMSPRGQILEMGFTAEVASDDLLSLAGFYGAQFVLPPDELVNQWRVIEEDVNSSWDSSYELMPDGIRMTKRRVTRVASSVTALPIRVDSSEIRSARGAVWLSYYDADETWSFLNGEEVVLSMRNRLQLTETAAEEPSALSLLEPGAALSAALKPMEVLRTESLTGEANDDSSIQRDKIAILREKYASVGAGDLIDELRSELANAKGHEDTVTAIHSIRDMVLAYPNRAMEVASFAIENVGDSAMTARLVHALELAGSTAEAQAALASIVGTAEAIDDELRLQAAVAAGGVESLKDNGLRDALYQAVRSENIEVSDAAGFALGSLARNNPELQKVLGEGYGPMLSGQEENPDDQRVALRILANGGIVNDSILADAARLAGEHRNRDVRIAAIDYLGKASPDSPETLISALGDPEIGVRIAAVKALTGSSRNTSKSIAAVASILTDPSAEAATQHAAVNGLANQATRFPEARQALLQALNRNETSTELRQQIRTLLADPTQPFFPN